MKRSKVFAFFMAVVCVLSLSITALAAEARVSDQIRSYAMDVTAITGTLAVDFSSVGNTKMKKIGCESIYIYKKSGTSWVYQDKVLEDDDGMSKANANSYTNTINWDSTAGVNYKVVVTIFAENSAGRDTRSQTFYVTGK